MTTEEKKERKEKIGAIILIIIVMLLLITVCAVAIIDSMREDKNNTTTDYYEQNMAMNENYMQYLPEDSLHPLLRDTYDQSYKGPKYYEYYYNVNMNSRIEVMRELGYTENDYPYYIRTDGCKMLGEYIMVAADSNTHHFGDIIDTSLGKGIVVDWMGSAYQDGVREIDLATAWY